MRKRFAREELAAYDVPCSQLHRAGRRAHRDGYRSSRCYRHPRIGGTPLTVIWLFPGGPGSPGLG
jgi:hypothetical protein